MSIRHYALLYILSLFILLLISTNQTTPGYMDAEYYFAGGQQIVSGRGFTEPYIWNYHSDPTSLPVPSHTYWMPLPSILAALSMLLTGSHTFTAARLIFILLVAAVPPLTAALSYSLRPRRDLAILAGMLAAIPGFYLPFLSTTATFAPYMFFGALFFLLVSRILCPITITISDLNAAESPSLETPVTSNVSLSENQIAKPTFLSIFNQPVIPLIFCLGIVAGLMYLTRSDGLLYLFIGLVALMLNPSTISDQQIQPSTFNLQRLTFLTQQLALSATKGLLLLFAGFLIVTLPWFTRNMITFGSPFPPGASRTLWLTNYDQLFSYPASILTFEHWGSSGINAILQARLWSLGQNLQTTIAVQGMVFLFPLILLALWQLRRNPVVQLGALAYLLTLLAMTLAFPFAGSRGGFFHSGAALQPLFWALAPIGLQAFVSWGAQRRRWVPSQALEVFSLGLIALAMLLTALTTLPRLLPQDGGEAPWNQGQATYSRLEVALVDVGASTGEVVLVNNPPGYYLASGRPAIVIPDGDPTTALAAADRYGARYLLLDRNHPQGLKDLYQTPTDLTGLEYLTTFESTHIFRIEDK